MKYLKWAAVCELLAFFFQICGMCRASAFIGATHSHLNRVFCPVSHRSSSLKGQVRRISFIGNSSTVTDKRYAPAQRTLELTPIKNQPRLGCVVQLHRAALPSPLRQVWVNKGKALGFDLRKGSLPEGPRQTAPPFGLVA